MKNTTKRKSGFTLVEIMIVVAIIGLLAAIAIPNFVRARSTSQQNACINNLRLIDAAKQQWALERGQPSSATPTLDANTTTGLQPYLGRGSAGTVPYCPLDSGKTGAYNIGAVSNKPTCNLGTDPAFNHLLP
jgi:prepilin-type N-terminal cleavage/methylation domain-containing protein